MLAVLLSAAALAHESTPQNFILNDDVELFSGEEWTTGWVPKGSPIMVQLGLVIDGMAMAEMEGQADLSWPEAVTLGITPTPGSGWLDVIANAALVASVKFDEFGYTYEAEVAREDTDLGGTVVFDPFLLYGDEPDEAVVDLSGETAELLTYEQDVFAGVSLVFTLDLISAATTTFTGEAWLIEEAELTVPGETYEREPTGEPFEEFDATFVGAWDSAVDLALYPSVEVCFDVVLYSGCLELFGYEFPVEIASERMEAEFPTTELAFPVPLISVDVSTIEFGRVDMDDDESYEIDVSNAGELLLTGDVLIEGDGFSVFPQSIAADVGASDPLLVMFAPEAAGSQTGVLTIESNDPATPSLQIVLSGVGAGEEVEEDDTTDTEEGGSGPTINAETEPEMVVLSTETGCGCASSPARGAGVWAFGLFGLLAARRRV